MQHWPALVRTRHNGFSGSNTEEKAIRKARGVAAREGETAWDHATGSGRVRAHTGNYHDAIHAKRNTLVLFLANTFGGLAPGAVTHLHDLGRRPTDRTDYVLTEHYRDRDRFAMHWARRLSAAAVTADARRCLHRLPGLHDEIRRAQHLRAPPRHE